MCDYACLECFEGKTFYTEDYYMKFLFKETLQSKKLVLVYRQDF